MDVANKANQSLTQQSRASPPRGTTWMVSMMTTGMFLLQSKKFVLRVVNWRAESWQGKHALPGLLHAAFHVWVKAEVSRTLGRRQSKGHCTAGRWEGGKEKALECHEVWRHLSVPVGHWQRPCTQPAKLPAQLDRAEQLAATTQCYLHSSH